jgi:predicted transcriptional regulator
MSKRVTVNLPDDVADRLGQEPNISAFVTDALRERMSRERTITLLAEHGFRVTEAGRARARERLAEARQRMTPERFAELRRVGRTTTA